MASFLECYQPPQPALWTGRSDSLPHERFFQVISLCDLTVQNTLPAGPGFAIIGFACDAGVERNLGRLGAKAGPDAIRRQLAGLALAADAEASFYDLGSISCDDGNLEQAQAALADLVCLALQQGLQPLLMGGGHEIAWGHYQGLYKAYPNKTIGIINFDAHFDMRPLLNDTLGSSGTPFLQIANLTQQNQKPFHYFCLGIAPASATTSLLDTAAAYNVMYTDAQTLQTNPPEKIEEKLQNFIQQVDAIYLTVCLDVFAEAVAPGVSAPQCVGVYPMNVLPFLQCIYASGKVISMDIAELAPAYDVNNRTARLAATIASEYLNNNDNFSRSEK